MAAYADDLLFFITSPVISLPPLLLELRRYGEISDFKINYSKSEAMGVVMNGRLKQQLADNFSFKWTDSHISYLGTKIPNRLNRIFELNYAPLIRQIKLDFQRWEKEISTWFGKINIIKMNIMPRILYLFQTLPVKLSAGFLKEMRARFVRSIWAGKPPRVRRAILTLPKERGGVGLPDPVSYYEAAHLARVVDWCTVQEAKPWIQLEQTITTIPLEGIVWLAEAEIPQEVKRHPTIGATIYTTRKIFKKTKMSTHPSPMIPILGNPSFEPGLIDQSFRVLKRQGISRVTHFSRGNLVMNREEIDRAFSEALDPFRRTQLNAFLQSLRQRITGIRKPSGFEQICLKREPLRHSLSVIYALLIDLEAPQELGFLQAWERDLGITFTEIQKKKILLFAHKASMATKYQEGGYKILTRWYRTPAVLNRMYPQVANQCWRCQNAEGTIFHIFWECPKLKEFWTMVSETVLEVTEVDLGDNPSAFLLHDIPLSNEKYKNSLIRHLITAAKACIPALWKTTTAPTKIQWMGRIADIQQMESLTMILREQEETYREIWAPYIKYREQSR